MSSSSLTLDKLNLDLTTLKSNLNQEFRLFIALWIIFMQCGFALLEAGAVRSKNTTNILFKNFLDLFVGALAYWIFGYGFAYGIPGNAFIGHQYFLSTAIDHRPYLMPNASAARGFVTSAPDMLFARDYYSTWISQFAFAATSSTIVSGAMAERTQFVAYLVYSFIITGFIYPLISHWCWADIGFLRSGAGTGIRFIDFAGSGVVHVTGGVAALIGASMLGSRIGRFRSGKGADVTISINGAGGETEIRGHSVPLVSIGGFILFTGFIAFNAGSQQNISEFGEGTTLSIAAMSTILAGASGGLSALIFNVVYNHFRKEEKFLSLLVAINGCLAGMVSSCAGSNQIYSWCALVLGSLSGICMVIVHHTLEKYRIDDPIGAVPVHLAGGIIGVTLAPFFVIKGQEVNGIYVGGIFYTTNAAIAWASFGWNLLGTVCIAAWTGLNCFVMFGALKMVGLLRISKREELVGLDVVKHGEPAYPESYHRITEDFSYYDDGREESCPQITDKTSVA